MTVTKIIHWLPRVLGIAFILFLSLFALDVFEEFAGWVSVLAFLIHLIPSFILLAVVAIAWKYEWVGAAAFLGFAVFYVIMVGLDRPWSWYVAISAPSALVGILFFISWLQKRRIGR